MKNNDLRFKRLSEEYVYAIIVEYIDKVDSHTQARLIKQFSQLHDQLYPETLHLTTSHECTSQINVRGKEHPELIQSLLNSYQRQMVCIMAAIEQMDRLIKRAELSQAQHSSSIVNHYKTIRERFVVSLERAQLFCQHERFRVIH